MVSMMPGVTLLQDVHHAFNLCISDTQGEATEAAEATVTPNGVSPSVVHVDLLLNAMEQTLQLSECFGPLLAAGIQKLSGHIQRAYTVLETAGGPSTVYELLEWEKKTGIHKAGGVLAERSAVMALLWIRRTLQFLAELMRQLLDGKGTVTHLAREAYAVELERYHGWLLRNTFAVALSAMPSREEIFARLAPRGGTEDECARVCSAQLGEAVRVVNRVTAVMRDSFVELDLEDTRKI